MKTVTVRYFAAFRERTGCDHETVATSAATASDLFVELAQRHPALESLGNMKVAINDELSDWTTEIHENDTVLLFPPVAGG